MDTVRRFSLVESATGVWVEYDEYALLKVENGILRNEIIFGKANLEAVKVESVEWKALATELEEENEKLKAKLENIREWSLCHNLWHKDEEGDDPVNSELEELLNT